MTLDIWHNTLSKPSRIWDILLWKCSGAEDMPKHRRLKQYLPDSVINVVRSEDSLAKGICQNSEFALCFENIFSTL